MSVSYLRVNLPIPAVFGTEISRSRDEELERTVREWGETLTRNGCPVRVSAYFLDCQSQLTIALEWPN